MSQNIHVQLFLVMTLCSLLGSYQCLEEPVALIFRVAVYANGGGSTFFETVSVKTTWCHFTKDSLQNHCCQN
jgi:hypothetical protein